MKRLELLTTLAAWSIIVLLTTGCAGNLDEFDQVLGQGNAYLASGQYEQAIADFAKAIEIDPRSAAAHNGRGRAYLGNGQYDQAITDFSKAIALNSEFADAYTNRGNAYRSKGMPIAKSVADWEKAKALRENQAITELSRAIKTDPDSSGSYVARATSYQSIGQFDLAIADYNKAIKLEPENMSTYIVAAFFIVQTASMIWLSLITARP